MSPHFASVNGQSIEPRIALYSHDTMGLGHLRRNILIASVLSEPPINANVLVISGAREACHFAMRAGVDCVTLPSLSKNVAGDYSSKHLRWTCQQTTRLRSKIIATALDAFSPHVFIVDKVPRGIGNELDETLSAIRGRGNTHCVLGLRDILDDPDTVMRQWVDCDAEQTIHDHYKEVWVYGDPVVYDTVRQYAFGCATADRTCYTGYLDPRRRRNTSTSRIGVSSHEHSVVACLVGGGQDGIGLASAFASARMPSGWNGILVTGPFLPDVDRAWLRQAVAARDDCTLIEDLVEADEYIGRADKVVSMAGYNTITSILSFEKPSLVVPRVSPRREQWIRASMFANRGLLTMLSPEHLIPAAITSWIQQPSTVTPNANSVDLTGLNRIVERIQRWVPQNHKVSPAGPTEVSIV